MGTIYHLLRTKLFLSILLVINVFGTIYGFIWYGNQLMETPFKFWAFVPDSPMASMFFCFVLILFLWKKNNGLIESLAIVTLFKYGFWAVIMNLLVLLVEGQLHWTGYMLIASHAGMAIQGLLYAPFYRMKPWHLIVTGIWILHNDFLDYVFFTMPRYRVLNDYFQNIGYFTFWLSIFSLGLTYYLCVRKKHAILSL